MNIFDRIEAGLDRRIDALRERSGVFDHLWRALVRFNDVTAGRLAAAISYYGFFAAFALTVVAYSVLGRVLSTSDGGFVGTVDEYLTTQLSWVKETADQVGTQQVTVIGSVALVLTGIGWIDALRSSTRAVWLLDEHPGHWIIRWLVDGVMLIVLGLLLATSLTAAWAIDGLLDWIAGPDTGAFGGVLVRSSGPGLQLAVNLVLSAALMTVVPRLRLSARRLLPTALIVAIGIQLLNSIGRWYIAALDDRPAYQLVTGTVGLLVYLYLLNQLILFGCALAATSTRGEMTDLSGAPAPGSTSGVENSGEPLDGGPSEPR